MLTLKGLNLNETDPAMALYGYARVSSSDQDFALQEQALRAAGCDVVRSEKASGTSRTGRTELATLLDFLRRGDTRPFCPVGWVLLRQHSSPWIYEISSCVGEAA